MTSKAAAVVSSRDICATSGEGSLGVRLLGRRNCRSAGLVVRQAASVDTAEDSRVVTLTGTPEVLGPRLESPEALAETAEVRLAVKVVVSVSPQVGGACCEGIPGRWISRKPALYPVEASLPPRGREDCRTANRGTETPEVKGSWSGSCLRG